MDTKKENIKIRLTETEKEILKEICKNKKITMSSFLRDCIEEEKKKLKI